MTASALLVLAAPASALRSRLATAADDPTPTAVAHTVRSGECFIGILAAHGVAADEVDDWHRAAQPVADLGRLLPGRVLHLSFDAGGRLQRLRYDLDGERRLVVERAGARVTARVDALPAKVRAVGARGIVKQSFYQAAAQAGIPDPIISEMVDLLGDVDFKSDIHRGDRFRVIYERRTARDGRPLKPGHVLAVDYAGRTITAAAYLYDVVDDTPVYVDADGHLLTGAPLRYPLEFTRISSTFSQARFHPILQRNRPHLGVDFAAPAGTPVRAVGPGVVKFAGVQSGFGNHVEIDHGGDFVSTYSHLQGIERAVRGGAKVERGQLLGWVGQTGLATGPHLHFAIFDHGEYVDPLSVKHPAHLSVVDARVFKRLRADLLTRLAAIPRTTAAATAPDIGLPPLAQAARVGPITLTF